MNTPPLYTHTHRGHTPACCPAPPLPQALLRMPEEEERLQRTSPPTLATHIPSSSDAQAFHSHFHPLCHTCCLTHGLVPVISPTPASGAGLHRARPASPTISPFPLPSCRLHFAPSTSGAITTRRSPPPPRVGLSLLCLTKSQPKLPQPDTHPPRAPRLQHTAQLAIETPVR